MPNVVEIHAICSCGAKFDGEAYFTWHVKDVMKAYRQFHRRHKNHVSYEVNKV